MTTVAQSTPAVRLACAALALVAVAGLSGCDSKEKKPGQALASVNGDEITVLQLNEELQRAGVGASQQDAASKQLLESLIDRQLLQSEAARDKTDRDPKVMQAIERAKAMIVAQAYLQKRVGTIARPDKAEVAAYFEKNPGFFTQRKTLEMRQLVLASKDVSDDLRKAIDGFKSIDEAAAWLDSHQVRYGRGQVSRTTADLPPEFSAKLLSMSKGQLFIVREGERTLLNVISDVKETPVTLEVAAPQIEQFLYNKKLKSATDAEVARLRAGAKIEYLNKTLAPKEATPPAAPAASPAASSAESSASAAADANARGVAGLK
ncbi:MAG: EpsD family peptidyl-prolyl cis-trans isomerase [Pseudomonadota bacterium]